MSRTAIDKNGLGEAESSDLRNTNPWLASYWGEAARNGVASEARWVRKSSRPSAPSVRLWAGALVAAPLMIATMPTEHVQAEVASASPGHYPLDQGGGIAVSSANLDEYLAALEGRATARKFLLTFGNLLFSAKSAAIGDSEKVELVRMADFLRAHPETIAHIVGHADDGGDKASNSRLAEQRAAVVRSYLIVQGIEQSRLMAMNDGEDKPLRDNSTQAGAAGNRRVEILVQKPEPKR
jgi:outer membrane protein OmpA-like peptidoglycan-associated protein